MESAHVVEKTLAEGWEKVFLAYQPVACGCRRFAMDFGISLQPPSEVAFHGRHLLVGL